MCTKARPFKRKIVGDHLWQSGPSVAAILGPGGPSMATKFAKDGPGGPLVAGDHLRRDSPFADLIPTRAGPWAGLSPELSPECSEDSKVEKISRDKNYP